MKSLKNDYCDDVRTKESFEINRRRTERERERAEYMNVWRTEVIFIPRGQMMIISHLSEASVWSNVLRGLRLIMTEIKDDSGVLVFVQKSQCRCAGQTARPDIITSHLLTRVFKSLRRLWTGRKRDGMWGFRNTRLWGVRRLVVTRRVHFRSHSRNTGITLKSVLGIFAFYPYEEEKKLLCKHETSGNNMIYVQV